MLLPNNLHQNSLPPSSIKFIVEDVLPWSKVQFTVCDGNNNFSSHDLAFVVCICIVFARAIVVIPLGRRIKGSQFFEPLVVIMMQPWLVVVDEDRGGYVHCVPQTHCVTHWLLSCLGKQPHLHPRVNAQRTSYPQNFEMCTPKSSPRLLNFEIRGRLTGKSAKL